MKIAITDTCIFIDLYELQLTPQLFQLPFSIHTSNAILEELYPDQQQLLTSCSENGLIQIHALSISDVLAINQLPLPAGLSFNDKSVLFLAEKCDAMVLSSDAQIRRTAGKRGIECHGMLWLLDQMVGNQILSPGTAVETLQKLCLINSTFQNNASLQLEINHRLSLWSSA